MKVKIDRVEWWPVICFTLEGGHEIDLPENIYNQYMQVFEEFELVQQALHAMATKEDWEQVNERRRKLIMEMADYITNKEKVESTEKCESKDE